MSSENFSWYDLLIISLKGRSTTQFYKGAVNRHNCETILAQFSKKWLCPCLCMHICISPFVELTDQFKLRLDKKAEISEIISVINLQLQLIVNYKFSKTRMLGKGTGPYEGRGKNRAWAYLFFNFMSEEFWTRRHDTNALEHVSIDSAVSVCVTLSVKLLFHQFYSRRDRGPTKASCSAGPDLLPVQSALWPEWGMGYGGKKKKKVLCLCI